MRVASPHPHSCERGYQLSPTANPFELPHVALHVVASDHPESVLVDEDAGGMARLPRCLRHLMPLDTIIGVPDVVAIALALTVPFHHPHAAIEDRDLMILTRLPGRFLQMARPLNTI